MGRQRIGRTGSGSPRRRWRVLAAALVAPAAFGLAAAGADASPNVCHITGVTRAVAKSVFPKLSGVSASQTEAATTPPNFGVCDVTPNTPPVASLEVELWSSTVFAQQTVAFTNDGKLQHLRGLGHGAFYSSVKGDLDDGNVLFTRGKYTVLIDPTAIGGSSADFPTEKQYLELARAIYKHLG
jgi:hypothetical protein